MVIFRDTLKFTQTVQPCAITNHMISTISDNCQKVNGTKRKLQNPNMVL